MGTCILLVSGCTHTANKQDTIIGSCHTHFMDDCKLSDIVSQVQFIPLETNDSVLVGKVRKIKQFLYIG